MTFIHTVACGYRSLPVTLHGLQLCVYTEWFHPVCHPWISMWVDFRLELLHTVPPCTSPHVFPGARVHVCLLGVYTREEPLSLGLCTCPAENAQPSLGGCASFLISSLAVLSAPLRCPPTTHTHTHPKFLSVLDACCAFSQLTPRPRLTPAMACPSSSVTR